MCSVWRAGVVIRHKVSRWWDVVMVAFWILLVSLKLMVVVVISVAIRSSAVGRSDLEWGRLLRTMISTSKIVVLAVAVPITRPVAVFVAVCMSVGTSKTVNGDTLSFHTLAIMVTIIVGIIVAVGITVAGVALVPRDAGRGLEWERIGV